MDAQTIVSALLENDDDDVDFSMDYIEQAGTPWNSLRLITSKEWRAFFRGLGFKVYSLYHHKATGIRRYGLMSMTLKPMDDHPVDYQDAALVTEYTYEMLEKRLHKDRQAMDLELRIHPYSAKTLLDVKVAVPDSARSYYSDYHPLDRM